MECELPALSSFFALKRWLGYQLMQDPGRPAEPLRQAFLAGYYGPAAATMGRYLRLLEDSIAAVEIKMSAVECYKRPYLTLPFYLECERLFDQAETQCASNPKALLHVRRERIPVDSGLFHMWSQLTRDLPAGTKLPVERETLLQRYGQYRVEQMAAFGTPAGLPKDKDKMEVVAEEIGRMRAYVVFEQIHKQTQQNVRIPQASNQPADGDPTKVDWSKAAELASWLTIEGRAADHKLSGRMVHDGRYLYVKLEHACDGTKLTASEEAGSGDGWDLYFAAQRQAPCRQLALDARGKVTASQWPTLCGVIEIMYKFVAGEWWRKDWVAGARVVSRPQAEGWTVVVSIPLESVIPGGVKKGGCFYASLCRSLPHSKQTTVARNPDFGNRFLLTQLTQLTLE